MKEERFAQKLDKLTEGCTCFACTNHTAAYVHHLIKCKEMTAIVLLVLHNMHVYNELFAQIHKALAQKRFAKFVNAYTKKNCHQAVKVQLEPASKADKDLSQISGILSIERERAQTVGDIKKYLAEQTKNL